MQQVFGAAMRPDTYGDFPPTFGGGNNGGMDDRIKRIEDRVDKVHDTMADVRENLATVSTKVDELPTKDWIADKLRFNLIIVAALITIGTTIVKVIP